MRRSPVGGIILFPQGSQYPCNLRNLWFSFLSSGSWNQEGSGYALIKRRQIQRGVTGQGEKSTGSPRGRAWITPESALRNVEFTDRVKRPSSRPPEAQGLRRFLRRFGGERCRSLKAGKNPSIPGPSARWPTHGPTKFPPTPASDAPRKPPCPSPDAIGGGSYGNLNPSSAGLSTRSSLRCRHGRSGGRRGSRCLRFPRGSRCWTI